MTVRASVPIQRGQPVFMSYAHSLEGCNDLQNYSKRFLSNNLISNIRHKRTEGHVTFQ